MKTKQVLKKLLKAKYSNRKPTTKFNPSRYQLMLKIKRSQSKALRLKEFLGQNKYLKHKSKRQKVLMRIRSRRSLTNNLYKLPKISKSNLLKASR